LHYASRARPTRDHAALKAALDAWFDEVKKAQWSTAANIKGNDYRLVVAVDFEKGIGWIKWIGTQGEYDKIDVKEVQHGD
jgi:mRNA interferase HigB